MRRRKTSRWGRLLTIAIYAIGLGALMPAAAHAQSLVDLFNAALDVDPAVAGTDAQFRASQQRVREATASILPSAAVTGTGSFSRFSPVSGGKSAGGTDYHTAQWSLQVSQPLYDSALSKAIDEAKGERNAAQAQLDAAQTDLLVRVVTAYFDVLTAREVLLAATRQKEATLQQLASAQHGLEIGLNKITDVKDAEAKHDLVVAQEVAAKSDLELKRAALSELVGTAQLALRVLPNGASIPDIGPNDLPRLIDQAIDSSPSVSQARFQLDAARKEVDKQRGGHYPTVTLALSFGSDVTNGTPSNPLPIHGNTGQAQLNLNVPIFSGFGTDAKIQEALALEDKARSDVLAAEQKSRTDVRESYYGLVSALGQVASLKAAEASTGEAAQANLKGALIGTNNTTDVLNAESQYFQAHRDLMKAKLDAWLNYLKLRIATGAPWQQGVESVDRVLVPENQVASEGG